MRATFCRRAATTAVIPLLLLATSADVKAHGVGHEVTRDEAVRIHLFHSDGSAFADVAIEIRRVEEARPTWIGRTDARGVFAFATEEDGPFECRAYSDDGHGTCFEFEIPTSTAGLSAGPRGPADRLRQIGLGLFVIAALFAGLGWTARRRAT